MIRLFFALIAVVAAPAIASACPVGQLNTGCYSAQLVAPQVAMYSAPVMAVQAPIIYQQPPQQLIVQPQVQAYVQPQVAYAAPVVAARLKVRSYAAPVAAVKVRQRIITRPVILPRRRAAVSAQIIAPY